MPSRFARGLVFPGQGVQYVNKGEWPVWRACAKAGLRRLPGAALERTSIVRGWKERAIAACRTT